MFEDIKSITLYHLHDKRGGLPFSTARFVRHFGRGRLILSTARLARWRRACCLAIQDIESVLQRGPEQNTYLLYVCTDLYIRIYIYIYVVSVVVHCEVGCWGAWLVCIVVARLPACCLPSLVGRGRLTYHARLSLVSRLRLLCISTAGDCSSATWQLSYIQMISIDGHRRHQEHSGCCSCGWAMAIFVWFFIY
jgi:hypothetical protein